MVPPGSIVATPSALHALAAAGRTPAELPARHAAGGWGETALPGRWQPGVGYAFFSVTVAACVSVPQVPVIVRV